MNPTLDLETTVTTSVTVCEYDLLTPDLGVAALAGALQVAVFRLDDGSVHAVQNLCPFSGASVISRGITGSRGEEPTVASPLHKQVFSLLDGRCLADLDKQPRPGLARDLAVYPVTVEGGRVVVEVPLEAVLGGSGTPGGPPGLGRSRHVGGSAS
jgi:nitrite reductase (NADH) small subunit